MTEADAIALTTRILWQDRGLSPQLDQVERFDPRLINRRAVHVPTETIFWVVTGDAEHLIGETTSGSPVKVKARDCWMIRKDPDRRAKSRRCRRRWCEENVESVTLTADLRLLGFRPGTEGWTYAWNRRRAGLPVHSPVPSDRAWELNGAEARKAGHWTTAP